MALRIEAPATIRLIEELSRRTGKSAEDVVEDALREQFDRLRSERDEESEAQRRADIYALAFELRALVKETPQRVQDPGDLLYGEDGLPT